MGWGVSHVVQVFSQFSAKLSDVRHLTIDYFHLGPDLEHDEWVQMLHPFTAVQTSRLNISTGHSEWVLRHLAAGDVTEEMVAEVLPTLSLLCFDFAVEPLFEKLVAVRRLSGCPVNVATTGCQFCDRLTPYMSEQDKDPHQFLGL